MGVRSLAERRREPVSVVAITVARVILDPIGL
jgi:hypothetical protein